MRPLPLPSARPLTQAALLAGALLGPACFTDPPPPPTFRTSCDQDQDCPKDLSCIRGLCETPCTQADSAMQCPFEDGYAGCINGACASTCPLPQDGESDPCPKPQSCVDLGIDLSGVGGGGFFGGGGSNTPTGVCTSSCSVGECPDGETCLEGFCVATCVTSGDCTTGFACLGGLCIPDFGGTTSGGATSGGTTSGGATGPSSTSSTSGTGSTSAGTAATSAGTAATSGGGAA